MLPPHAARLLPMNRPPRTEPGITRRLVGKHRGDRRPWRRFHA